VKTALKGLQSHSRRVDLHERGCEGSESWRAVVNIAGLTPRKNAKKREIFGKRRKAHERNTTKSRAKGGGGK
jgi:hypothetical protein